MSEFLNINSIIDSNKDVVLKKNTPALPVLITSLGVICAALPAFAEVTPNITFASTFIGASVAIIGLFMLFKPKRYLFYKPTSEKLREQVFYFDSDDKKAVSSALKGGDINLLRLMKSSSTNMRVITYATGSHSYLASQMQIYVPYEYVPVEEAVIIKR